MKQPYNNFTQFNKSSANTNAYRTFPTPRVGLEPTTPRLTAACSTIELSRIIYFLQVPSKLHTRNLSSILLPIHLWSCPRPISCGQLHTLLHFHLRPIYLVVFKGSYYLLVGISHLEGGFTLRCLQRLSPPGLATLPWP